MKVCDSMKCFKDRVCGFLGNDSSQGSGNRWVSFGIAVAIVILLNIAGSFFFFSIDLTSDNSYSLSDISEDVVDDLAGPMQIKVFFSDNLPAPYNNVRRYLGDLLESYDSEGGSNFSFEFVNVESEEGQKTAESFGIYPVEVREMQTNEFKAKSAYMGLVIIYGDLVEKIADVSEAEGLEYRLTSAMQKMHGKAGALQLLSAPLRMTLYIDSSLAPYNISGLDKTEAIVKEIFAKANENNFGKLELEIKDPAKDGNAAEIAAKYGLGLLKLAPGTGRNGNVLPGGDAVLGIVLEKGDRFEAIPLGIAPTMFGQNVIAGLDSVEDNLNRAINILVSDNPPVGYVVSNGTKNLADQREGAAVLKSLLSDMYEVREVTLADGIPSGIKTLILNGVSESLSPFELYQIDQFVMKGGSVLFLVDSFREIQDQQQQMMMMGGQPLFVPMATGLDELLASYGVTVKANYVLDMNCFVARQQGQNDMPLYFVPVIQRSGFNHDNPVVEYLKEIMMYKASSLEIDQSKLDAAGITVEPLVQSSERAWLMEGRINLNPMFIQPPDESGFGQYTLAVALEGAFKSHFTEAVKPEAKEGENGSVENAVGSVAMESYLAKAIKPSRMIVIGTSEITTPRMIDPQGKSPVAVFVRNAVDYLNYNDQVPEMRSKGLGAASLGRKPGWVIYLFVVTNILLPIVISIIAGVVAWFIRKRRKAIIKARYAGGN